MTWPSRPRSLARPASSVLRRRAVDARSVGELALDGSLRAVPGVLALTAAARSVGIDEVIVPNSAAREAAAVEGIVVRGAATLGDAVAHLVRLRDLPAVTAGPIPAWAPAPGVPDLVDVMGQPLARRALELAVAGRHSLALTGPPGVGKTLLLRCAEGLLPPLEEDEAVEVSRIHSVAGLLDRQAPVVRRRPFRVPHHTISTQALVGGGSRVRPGEASLAHRGALVLDELLQFRADALEALRQPLEVGDRHDCPGRRRPDPAGTIHAPGRLQSLRLRLEALADAGLRV